MSTSTVVLTGTGSGIGRACAARFLATGATVVGFDRVAEQEAPAGAGDGAGGRWHPRELDVTDPAAVTAAFAAVAEEFGPISVLVTSAGVGYPEPFGEMALDSWDRVFAVNVTGTMLCVQAALPGMVEQGSGAIVVLSSIAGRTKSVTNGAHYTVSKYGLIGLTRHLAAELAGTGVRINCVAPGPTWSPLLVDGSSEEERQAIIDRTPLRRIADPEDVAAVVAFAADERARQVHGAVLDVNGGLY
jgi:3-oxoacyl-[acyl-carrier protein] reductase